MKGTEIKFFFFIRKNNLKVPFLYIGFVGRLVSYKNIAYRKGECMQACGGVGISRYYKRYNN